MYPLCGGGVSSSHTRKHIPTTARTQRITVHCMYNHRRLADVLQWLHKLTHVLPSHTLTNPCILPLLPCTPTCSPSTGWTAYEAPAVVVGGLNNKELVCRSLISAFTSDWMSGINSSSRVLATSKQTRGEVTRKR